MGFSSQYSRQSAGQLIRGSCQNPWLLACLLGGSWDLVTTSNWAYDTTYSFPNWPYMDYSNYKQGSKPSYK